MRNGSTVFVDCIIDGNIIRTYDFLVPYTTVPGIPPSDGELISEAKNNLSVEKIAAPPFANIKFVVRR
ncbi:hypothetical protein FE249_20660 (plasmid) [Acidiphilium multivorum]|uniref:hypothetical protein n=1 Tax=Acidiphilium multivorum TaxID=62140 RepID=UPI001F4C1B45|nr:hypothetical protein [Acidiphilium multivorum]UNC16582.1 hypothetical protein FE249_20660 [Acidiphilium multivorum]